MVIGRQTPFEALDYPTRGTGQGDGVGGRDLPPGDFSDLLIAAQYCFCAAEEAALSETLQAGLVSIGRPQIHYRLYSYQGSSRVNGPHAIQISPFI